MKQKINKASLMVKVSKTAKTFDLPEINEYLIEFPDNQSISLVVDRRTNQKRCFDAVRLRLLEDARYTSTNSTLRTKHKTEEQFSKMDIASNGSQSQVFYTFDWMLEQVGTETQRWYVEVDTVWRILLQGDRLKASLSPSRFTVHEHFSLIELNLSTAELKNTVGIDITTNLTTRQLSTIDILMQIRGAIEHQYESKYKTFLERIGTTIQIGLMKQHRNELEQYVAKENTDDSYETLMKKSNIVKSMLAMNDEIGKIDEDFSVF